LSINRDLDHLFWTQKKTKFFFVYERDTYAQRWTNFEQYEGSGSSTPQPYSTDVLPAYANHVRARSELRDPNVHH